MSEESMINRTRYYREAGDYVALPDGRKGYVEWVKSNEDGFVKEVTIKPTSGFFRFRKRIRGAALERLDVISSAEEMRGLGTDDCSCLEPYRYRVKKGDRVNMPDGRLGIVVSMDILMAGRVKEVVVRPFGSLFRQRFYDGQIEQLIPLPAE